MKFIWFQKWSIFGLAIIAVAPLIASGELSIGLGPVFGIMLLIGWLLPVSQTKKKSHHTIVTALVLLVFFVQCGRIAVGQRLATVAIEFAVLLLGLKMCSTSAAKDASHILILSLLCLIASTATSYTLSYGAFFIAFVLIFPLAMSLTHLHAEMDERFAKANQHTQQRLLNSKRIIQPKYILALQGTSLLLLAATIIIFAALPRWGFGMGSNAVFNKKLLGFTEQVEIGDLSTTIENTTVYMRIWPSDTTPPLPSQLPLKLRGAVFDTYKNGKWTQQNNRVFKSLLSVDGKHVLSAPKNDQAVTLRIMQEPTNPPYLFVPRGTQSIQTKGKRRRGRIHHERLKKNGMGVIKYNDAKRVGIEYSVQLGGSPLQGSGLREDLNGYLTIPKDFDRIGHLAAQWTQTAQTKEQQIQQIIKELQQRYQYVKSIPKIQRDLAIQKEILKKFLFDYRRGTCEHFATAATLMLRTLGIPTRFITGFSSAKWNPIGEYYAVDASAAHAWTEVYLNGQWYPIDATPAAQNAPGQHSPKSKFFENIIDTLAMHWHRYVVDYDDSTQKAIWKAIRPNFTLSSLSNSRNNSGEHNVDESDIAIVLIVIIVLIIAIKYRNQPKKWTRKRKITSPSHFAATQLLLLLEKQLRPYGLKRTPFETPTEYLEKCIGSIPIERNQIEPILQTYHQARFGNKPLLPNQFEAAQDQIRKLPPPSASQSHTNIE